MPFERRDAWIVRKLPFVKVANCWDDEVVVLVCLLQGLGVAYVDSPLRFCFVPICTSDFGTEASLGIDVVFLSYSLPIGENLRALGKYLRPLRVRLECALIHVGRNITAYARVTVLEPSTSL